ncbi:MAG: hypothetical protein IJR88_02105 [Clostridia bacterium]|nr:hypothetical protein [Clostridia bacterium]
MGKVIFIIGSAGKLFFQKEFSRTLSEKRTIFSLASRRVLLFAFLKGEDFAERVPLPLNIFLGRRAFSFKKSPSPHRFPRFPKISAKIFTKSIDMEKNL